MCPAAVDATFSDWCAEQTNFPSEVREMALAHAVGDKVEASYAAAISSRSGGSSRRRGHTTAKAKSRQRVMWFGSPAVRAKHEAAPLGRAGPRNLRKSTPLRRLGPDEPPIRSTRYGEGVAPSYEHPWPILHGRAPFSKASAWGLPVADGSPCRPSRFARYRSHP